MEKLSKIVRTKAQVIIDRVDNKVEGRYKGSFWQTNSGIEDESPTYDEEAVTVEPDNFEVEVDEVEITTLEIEEEVIPEKKSGPIKHDQMPLIVAPKFSPIKYIHDYSKSTSNSWIYLLMIASVAAAQITLIWSPRVGVFINALALVIAIAIAIAKDDLHKTAVSLGILPIVNMVVISFMPSQRFTNSIVFYDVLLLLALVYRFIFTTSEPVKKSSLGLNGYAIGLPIMIVVGEILSVIGFVFLRHHYQYRGISLPLVALAAVVFAFAEEMFLRGLIQQQGSKVFNPLMAAFGTTLLYVVLGLYHGTMLSIPVAVVIGATLSYTYYKKQNLVLTTTMNAVAKLGYLGLVAGFIFR
jgi:membrane protease YdiL (CAAX protease family)